MTASVGVIELLQKVEESIRDDESEPVPEAEPAVADVTHNAEPKRFKVGSSVYARLQHGWVAAIVLETDNVKDAYKLEVKDGSSEVVYAPIDTDAYVRQDSPSDGTNE